MDDRSAGCNLSAKIRKNRMSLRDIDLITCILFVTTIILQGCSDPHSSSPLPTASQIISSPSDTPVSNTPTIISSLTPTLTATQITPEELQAEIISLIKNNSNCRFPCIWGQTPGKTSGQSIQDYLRGFINAINPQGQDFLSVNANAKNGLLYFQWIENELTIEFNLGYKVEHGIVQEITLNSFPIVKGSNYYDFGNSQYKNLFHKYLLSEILSVYGKPSFVYVRVYLSYVTQMPVTPFQILLFYPEEGIFIVYETEAKKVTENTYEGCPDDSVIWITAFDPGSNRGILDINNGGSFTKINKSDLNTFFKDISEATDMTLDDFYNRFSNPANLNCLKTPVDIWPYD